MMFCRILTRSCVLLQHLRHCVFLDFGCGPGRDLQTLTKLGHEAIGLEGSAEAAHIARAVSGCKVWVQDFFCP